jgi:hypothetical protein
MLCALDLQWQNSVILILIDDGNGAGRHAAEQCYVMKFLIAREVSKFEI